MSTESQPENKGISQAEENLDEAEKRARNQVKEKFLKYIDRLDEDKLDQILDLFDQVDEEEELERSQM